MDIIKEYDRHYRDVGIFIGCALSASALLSALVSFGVSVLGMKPSYWVLSPVFVFISGVSFWKRRLYQASRSRMASRIVLFVEQIGVVVSMLLGRLVGYYLEI